MVSNRVQILRWSEFRPLFSDTVRLHEFFVFAGKYRTTRRGIMSPTRGRMERRIQRIPVANGHARMGKDQPGEVGTAGVTVAIGPADY